VEAIQRVPIQLYTVEDLFAWTVEIHNMVNRRTRKPVLSLCEAQRIWLPQSTSCQTYPGGRPNGTYPGGRPNGTYSESYPRNTTIYFS
jgi:hypothetical protein